MDTFKIFFPLLFSWQSLQQRTAEPSPVCDLPWGSRIQTGNASSPCFVFWGWGSVCEDVGGLGWEWCSGEIPEGWWDKLQVHWAFRTEKQLAGGPWREEESKVRKKIYISFYCNFANWENILLGGRCLPRTSNSVCSTHFIFKPECRFYSWDVIGPVWAGMGKLTSEIFTSWKGPSESLQVNFRGESHFLFLQRNATLMRQKKNG